MSRMADRIQTGEVDPPFWQAQDWTLEARQHMRDELQAQLRAVPIVVADNVCEYLYAGTDQEEWHLKTDFPTLAPPFPMFWLEMRRPSRIVSTDYAERSSRGMPYAWGYFCQAIEPDDAVAMLADDIASGDTERLGKSIEASVPFMQDDIREKWRLADDDSERFWNSLNSSEQALIVNTHLLQQIKLGAGGRWVEQLRSMLSGQQVRWVMRADLWIEPEKGQIIGPVVNHTFLLNAQGEAMIKPLFHLYMTDGALRHHAHVKPLLDSFSTMIFPACLTLSFFHCKNVSVHHEQPSSALSKAHTRRYGVPLLRYHRLDIHPMQRVLAT